MCNFNTPPIGFKQMSKANLWTRWQTIHQTANPLPGAPLDIVSKWMLITRSYVFEMDVYAAMVGILLALQFLAEPDSIMYYDGGLIIVGLILAHAANNMMNDFFDTLHGVDTKGYPRTEYGPHALIDNLISTKGLIIAIFLCNLIDLGIAIYFYLSWEF